MSALGPEGPTSTRLAEPGAIASPPPGGVQDGRTGPSGGGGGALARVVRAGVGRRRVQTVVMVLTTLLAVAASVLGAGLLVASQGPFEQAFSKQHGAHLSAEFDATKVSSAQLAATADADGVAAAAGPFPVASLRLESASGGPPGIDPPPVTVVGRAEADQPVDQVNLVEGKWATKSGEIVLETSARTPGIAAGSKVEATGPDGKAELTVTGIAESVGESADAWVLPAQLSRLAASGADSSYQMLYRFDDADSQSAVVAGKKAVSAGLPDGALRGAQSWLDVKQIADNNVSAFVPFVSAFALIALAMSVLIISIVVSGAVVASTRRIGILKAIGFTPSQVGRAYVGQALIPASLGALLGVVVGNLLAIPMLNEVETAYGTSALPIPLWIDILVPLAALALVVAAALGPAMRAARLRTAVAINVGRTPSEERGRHVRGLLARLPVPRSVSLGLATPFARPARAATTAAAVGFGALAITFAVGLGSSLFAIQTHGNPDSVGDVTVSTMGRPGAPERGGAGDRQAPTRGDEGTVPGTDSRADGGATARDDQDGRGAPGTTTGPQDDVKPADPAKVAAAIKAQSGTGSYFGTGKTYVSVAGIKAGTPLVVYEGDAKGAGQVMVSGRWFSAPGEAVAPARFLQATGAKIGDTVTLTDQGHSVRLKLVGEIFDLGDQGMAVRADAASVAQIVPDVKLDHFTVELASGKDKGDHLDGLNTQLKKIGGVATSSDDARTSTVIVVMQSLIAMLTAMLVVVACLCVLNTVVLDTSERVHDVGVFKALGMSPRQTVTMVLTSVAATGLVAGAIGVPLGVALHHLVMPAMGRSTGTEIPTADIDVYGPGILVLLALGGVVIAAAGALLPAGWAARTGTARALRTE
ncbi:ABC transporter permease [Streptomyces pseudovenezuelae]|uniref:ABC transport system permease protein n=1 Tax=Streptomyces pseudovenezuelae TaxID=67350 RepID=A0ABT6LRD8_9ACTN|nr:ABC transporter permease [Streptomyces pseudovenezuelae]MDH6218886.1 putative ABC transport system permease protein [Streptomyces pseudovenezuelae]